MTGNASDAITSDSSVTLANNHFRADHDGSAIIMSISAGTFMTFDDIGFEIWDELGSDPVRVDALAAKLAERHNAPTEVVQADVITFLGKLADNALIDVT